MKYGIIVDSGCDLKVLEETDIYFERVPLVLRLGEQEFIDNDELNVDEYIKEMKRYTGATGSAAPSPGSFQEAFMQADEVIAFTLTSALSGSYNSAMTARELVLEEYPDKKLHVVDTKSAGAGMTALVFKTVELMKQGLDFQELVNRVEEHKENTKLLFLLESLDNLIKNGRVNRLVGELAGLLNIRILGRANESGELQVLDKVRGKQTPYHRLVQQMAQKGFHGEPVVIGHCQNEEKAVLLRDIIKQLRPECEVKIMSTGGLCSYYAEVGGIMVGF